jgi:hypothetical protein
MSIFILTRIWSKARQLPERCLEWLLPNDLSALSIVEECKLENVLP